jgi:urease accessory protein
MEAWRCATSDNYQKLLQIAELAAAFRGTSEFALETSQQGKACLATLRHVWPDPLFESLSVFLADLKIPPVLSVILGVCTARQDNPANLALPAFLQGYLANVITAGVRLVPLGQTDGQLRSPSLSLQCWPWLQKLKKKDS